MTLPTAVEDEQLPPPSQCWCCGMIDDPARLVRLGSHPEVAVCVRCAHSLSKEAWELEDQSRTGLAVRARDRMRRMRKSVMRHGWQNKPIIGPVLRRAGRFAP